MKYNFPIEIDMEKFVTNGEFDCIRIGQTKEWILNNFPDPDYGCHRMSYKDKMWGYGSFEFFFEKNQLTTIFIDHLPFKGEETLKVKKWIFEEEITLSEFLKIVNNARINFLLEHDKYGQGSIEVLVINSKVKLCFLNDDDAIKDRNDFVLCSISLQA